jgi:hypothetical protein
MRTFTRFGQKDSTARDLVNQLAQIKDNPTEYRRQMRYVGHHLADGILATANAISDEICVVCTVEDADFLARGLIERLEEAGLASKIHLICLWNDKIKKENVSLSPVVKEYKEEFDSTNTTTFIIVKSIISGACVVKTNLTYAISIANPTRIFVASPVMLEGAEGRLAHEFPEEISRKFEFVTFAIDTDKDGENVIPGIGGSVYELLGLGNSKDKNRYVPRLVKERRAKFFGAPLVPA